MLRLPEKETDSISAQKPSMLLCDFRLIWKKKVVLLTGINVIPNEIKPYSTTKFSTGVTEAIKLKFFGSDVDTPRKNSCSTVTLRFKGSVQSWRLTLLYSCLITHYDKFNWKHRKSGKTLQFTIHLMFQVKVGVAMTKLLFVV